MGVLAVVTSAMPARLDVLFVSTSFKVGVSAQVGDAHLRSVTPDRPCHVRYATMGLPFNSPTASPFPPLIPSVISRERMIGAVQVALLQIASFTML